jgi:DNA end-binding protein Ku
MMFPHGDALVLNLLRFPQEIVAASEFNFPSGALSKFRITPAELAMAENLLKSMAGDWKPAQYKDEFRDKLKRLLQKRVDKEHGTLALDDKDAEKSSDADGTNVVDFMALLKKSLASKGGAKGAAKASAKDATKDAAKDAKEGRARKAVKAPARRKRA